MDENCYAESAARACAWCKKNKRRCDKSLPSCSLCKRMGRECDYSDHSPKDSQARIQELEELVARLMAQSRTPSSTTSYESALTTRTSDDAPSHKFFLQSIFLDADISEFLSAPVIASDAPIPREVSDVLGSRSDIDMMISQYYGNFDAWMPIINRSRLERLLDMASTEMRSDLALLLLSMRLVQQVPSYDDAERLPIYIATKRFCFALEMAGTYSLLKVQAGLLIAVYELGHAILPAAYTSVGACARQGISLGIHKKNAPQILKKPRNWLDWEERQRVWWFIIILDRYVTAGGDNRPLCTEDQPNDAFIPADEMAWAGGEMVPPERLFLSTPTSVPVSPFARMAQASNLLGRTIRHCNDEKLEAKFVLEDVELLSQTTTSLLLLLTDNSEMTGDFNVAAALCLSSLMKISDFHSCDSFPEGKQPEGDAIPIYRECTARALTMLRNTACQIVHFVEILEQRFSDSMDSMSPLVLHCIYRACAALAWMALEKNDGQYSTGKDICVRLLRRANVRWKAAGAYLEILEALERELEQHIF